MHLVVPLSWRINCPIKRILMPSRVGTISVLSRPTIRANQPFPQPAVPSSVGEIPLTDHSSSKRQRISYQNASTSTQQALSTFTKDRTWITSNNSHKSEFEEAEEVHDLEHLERRELSGLSVP